MSFLKSSAGVGSSTTVSAVNINTPGGDSSKDVEVGSPPSESISALDWSSRGDYLAATSWDNQLRIWEVNQMGQTRPVSSFAHDAPLLSCRWTKDGTKIVAAGADKIAKLHDMTTGQSVQIAAHDAAVRCVRMFDDNHVLTGSFDRTVRGWDLRAPNTAVFTVNVGERVYSMDCAQNKLVVATAKSRCVQLLDVANIGAGPREFKMPLEWQLRVVTCFPNGSGFAAGSIEGRCAIQCFDPAPKTDSFSFKCHRAAANGSSGASSSGPSSTQQSPSFLAFPVHDITFHPVSQHALVTCGGDGAFHFWDKQARTRLKVFNSAGSGMPITATAFNRTGSMLAYSSCYDWSRGHAAHAHGSPVSIRIHQIQESDIKPNTGLKKR